MNIQLAEKTLLTFTRPIHLEHYAKRVIQFNDVARNGRPPITIDKQWAFVCEEFKEFIEALEQGDLVHIVKEACDLFVVSSYAARLMSSNFCMFCDTMYHADAEDHPDINLWALKNLILNSQPTEEVTKIVLYEVSQMLFSLNIDLDSCMRAVLDSNDSKFPTVKDLMDHYYNHCEIDLVLQEECKAIEERSNGRYHGIYYVGSNVTEQPRFVFFDDKGKIMKPSTYKDAETDLEIILRGKHV